MLINTTDYLRKRLAQFDNYAISLKYKLHHITYLNLLVKIVAKSANIADHRWALSINNIAFVRSGPKHGGYETLYTFIKSCRA